MRILAGKFKGKRLFAGKDLSIRPLTNRLKENIFNILQDFVIKKKTLDLFCGSGSFGLEALSRGALRVDFVDQAENSIKYLKTNLSNLGLEPGLYKIYHQDAMKFCLHMNISYDLILMDPPFKFQLLQELTEQIADGKILSPKGILVVHHELTNPLASSSEHYKIFDQRRYGRSLISFINHGDSDA